MIKDILLKFKRNECTEEEHKIIAEFFMQYPEELDKYMTEDEWIGFDLYMMNEPNELFENLYRNIERKILSRSRKFLFIKKISYAAAIALFFFISYKYYNKQNAEPKKMVLSNNNSQDTIVFNSAVQVRQVLLSDSSVVKLYPKSNIKYSKIFAGNKRDIMLQGKAEFYVAKNKYKPFTVYAGNTATTALGTVFVVNQNLNTNEVSVHLYRGKIVIKHYEKGIVGDVLAYLNPGNDFNNVENKIVSHTKKHIGKEVHTVINFSGIQMDFNNTPLIQILYNIRMKTGVQFDYLKTDIDNITYTGAYNSSKQSLNDFLNTIALLNSLSIESKDSVSYKIYMKH